MTTMAQPFRCALLLGSMIVTACSGRIDAREEKLKLEDLVAKHIASIGTPEALAAVRSLFRKAFLKRILRMTILEKTLLQVPEDLCSLSGPGIVGHHEDGFLQELDKWNEEFAQEYAREEGIEGPLTEEHWKIIHYLRSYYQQFGIAPMIRKLCMEGTDCGHAFTLY
jgi:hypothetical protein